MNEAYIIDACRTPRGIGKKGKGALAGQHPHHLGAVVLAALQQRNDFDTAEVGDIVFGTSAQRGRQSADLARMASLEAGYDIRSSAVTLDRFCGSGITSVSLAAMNIMSGTEALAIGGGAEMMSTYVEEDQPASPFLDNGNEALRTIHPQPHQGICADVIATLEGFSREQLDAAAYDSQQKAAAAIAENRFAKSLVPVYDVNGDLVLDREEFPRPQTTLEGLAELNASFGKMADIPLDEKGTTYRQMVWQKYPDLEIQHVHHAGNSSGVVDGAGAILLASGDYAKTHGMKPRAKVRAMANMGDCPTLMLNAPVNAAKRVLERAGLSVADIDLFEINEAFAVVSERFIRELDLDRSKVNVNGGAMALGHPIGATGCLLIGTVLDELERQDKQFGLVTMCAAGGMAPAIIIERV
ncbi:acetyl-CoA C-acyltransferase [Parahaliea maris]|uniref:Acetyl-CoA C-acyltransferase n=1 Tax=Parahaliea maris TaxID=2716870 RepID=A0A5C8ZP77_9GAMM|nr:acetyl-CoA C-acetyltransferase [Parahaliea maris]TXS89520.1 acetyl-CoA C-acyltransferase [Parahaliea maris]